MELECYKEHTKKLRHHVEQLTKEDIMLAFSGGVDSTLLLYLSCEAAKKLKNFLSFLQKALAI